MKIEYIDNGHEEIIKVDGEVFTCHDRLYSGDWIDFIERVLGVKIDKQRRA